MTETSGFITKSWEAMPFQGSGEANEVVFAPAFSMFVLQGSVKMDIIRAGAPVAQLG
jgi:hypothetical protein